MRYDHLPTMLMRIAHYKSSPVFLKTGSLKSCSLYSKVRMGHIIHGKVRVTVWRVRVMWVTIWYLNMKQSYLASVVGSVAERFMAYDR